MMSVFDILGIGVGLSMDAFAVSMGQGLCMDRVRLSRALLIAGFFGFYDGIRDKADSDDLNLANLGKLLLLAVATSIDAFAVGISFSMQKEIVWLFGGTSIFLAVGLIGCTTFVLSLIGIVLGHRFGMKYRRAATIFGGAILVLIGIKILLEAYGLLPPLLSCQLS